ncbi:MAG: VOC family protein [Oscillospiraceae bacterium]|nr:VOC family protein [Oscillospiraceae bacterium]
MNLTHHIAIICSNYEKSMDFYVKKLGFSVIRAVERPQQNDMLIMLQQGQTVLELFIRSDAPTRPTDPEALGLRHLAFHVENIDPAVAWLNERGIETEPVREDKINGGRFTFFNDPDGLPLELHE